MIDVNLVALILSGIIVVLLLPTRHFKDNTYFLQTEIVCTTIYAILELHIGSMIHAGLGILLLILWYLVYVGKVSST